ncbi:toxin-antitoxin system YwqK family antitoxin [Mucilaginibacter pedocola]|uniref:Outer membrane lipoprotein-sorting protein n=1 Tax=Mucilaginibacter pedocola TaxID=1792845 RepID=A0A1S9PJL2_9SPHI|nr:hypothetical protein [Mucilaginibacter pedocola]OOQ61109.1 hypothetical protein BC343_21955 [Mucilaginibacter pedocola]
MLKTKLQLLASFLFIIITSAQAQEETTTKTNWLTDSIKETYTVLKTNKHVKQGSYTAMFRKKTPIATGTYDHDKRVGPWRFYDSRGVLMQTYDFSNSKLLFEAPEYSNSKLHYFADTDIDSTDVVTKPIKIGGRYYGFLPYLRLFTLPNDIWNINRITNTAQVELLISPLGRLAYYWVRLTGINDYERVFRMNLELPDPADNVFTPATKNGQPIACRIIIEARITEDGHLDFRN